MAGTSQKHVFKIASIPGDGIGTEITASAVQVLNSLAKAYGTFEFEFHEFDWSSKNYETRHWYMPDDGIQQLEKFDAIYFGAVGWPSVPDHISLWGLILPIRKAVRLPPLLLCLSMISQLTKDPTGS